MATKEGRDCEGRNYSTEKQLVVANVMQSFPCKHQATIRLVTTLVRKENIKQTLHFHDLTSLSRITMMNHESYITVMNQESRM